MRILQLTTDLRYSGAEHMILELVRELRDRGHECAVAGLFEGGRKKGKLRAELQQEGFTVFCAGIEKKWMLWKALPLHRFIRDWAPDVLHTHLFHANTFGALLRMSGPRRPLIWTHHNVERRRLPLRRAVARMLAHVPDAHVCVSRAVVHHWWTLGGKGTDTRVIYNGIEISPFLAVEPRPGLTFGAVGMLIKQKGFDVLIKAFAEVAHQHCDATLKIAGEGPEREGLALLARQLDVGDRVELLGFVDDVPGFLSDLNIFVMPSRWEGFGLTLLEALAAGLPCIASRVDSLPEVGGDVVRWTRPEDVEGLGRAMLDVSEADYEENAIAARKKRAEIFSPRRMADQYVALYRSLL